MNPQAKPDLTGSSELDATLAPLAALFADTTRLPEAAALLRRAQLREKELAAAGLARWHARLRHGAFGLLAMVAVGVAVGMDKAWTAWLVLPLVEPPPAPVDAAVIAGAVLAASAAVVWVAQQFAEE
ncbi:MAG: hypothetical protein ABIV06_04550 [Thermoanaerobaculia bacterium]